MGAVDISEKQINEIETKLFVDAMENLDDQAKALAQAYSRYATQCRKYGRLLVGQEHADLMTKVLCFQSVVAWNVGVNIAMEEVVSKLQKNVEEMDKMADDAAMSLQNRMAEKQMHEDEGRQSMAFAMEGPGPDGE